MILPKLLKIGPVVVEKRSKMKTFYRKTDKRRSDEVR
jgi:hypothetical protein